MKRKLSGLLVVTLLLAILAYFNRQDIELVKQDDMKMQPLGEGGSQLNSVIHLYNPNLLSSTIKTVKEKFYLNGVLLSSFDMQLDQGIPGRKESEFPIGIRFTNADYAKALAIDSTGNANIRITGEITFQNLLTGGTVNIQQAQVVAAK